MRRARANRCRTGLLTLALLSAATAACRVESGEHAEAGERARRTGYRGFLLAGAPPKPDFTLTDTEGRAYDFRAETDGFVTLVFFGYTYCPDVCPVHMASIAAVRRELPVSLQRRIKVVFVTVDPERDTAERLRSWLDTFDRSFVGLRGEPERVGGILQAMDLPPAVVPDTAGRDYLVGHASQVIAFSPDGAVRVVYPFGTRQADWQHDLPRLAELP